MSISVRIKVLHAAIGCMVTCETVTGDVYKGLLIEAEDSMDCHLKKVTVTNRMGTVSQSEDVYIRGSKITFFMLPDMLMNAPMFKNQPQCGTAQRVKSAILVAQAAREGYGINPSLHIPGGRGPSRGRGGRERGLFHWPGVHGRGNTSSM